MNRSEIKRKLFQQAEFSSFLLLGICGSGMIGIARLLSDLGHCVSGIDSSPNTVLIKSLEERGIKYLGKEFLLPAESFDFVIYSTALSSEIPIFQEIQEKDIPCFSRSELLAIFLESQPSLCVTGTHGKTNTTALMTHMFQQCGVRVSHYIGGEANLPGKSARWDWDARYFIFEGDESNGDLSKYTPDYALILNGDLDHVNYYSSQEELQQVYANFLDGVKLQILYCKENLELVSLCSRREKSLSYGFTDADYIAKNKKVDERGSFFQIYYREEFICEVRISLLGDYQILNALGVIAYAHLLGLPMEEIAESLSSFQTTKNRFENKGEFLGIRFIYDYAHCPLEVSAIFSSIQFLNAVRRICVFQPHRYTRLKKFIDEFASSFSGFDKVFLLPVYSAGEEEIGFESDILAEKCKNLGIDAEYLPNFLSAHHRIGNFLKRGDILTVLGAGNIYEMSEKILRDFSCIEGVVSTDLEKSFSLYEPLSQHTTLGVGGPAQFWFEPENIEQLRKIVCFSSSQKIPLTFWGRGSNVLAQNGGVPGINICLSDGEFGEVFLEEGKIYAGSGVRLKKLCAYAEKSCLSGFEWMEGIPGNVGGSIRMNAGAMGEEIFSPLLTISVMDFEGKIQVLEASSVQKGYRLTQGLKNYIILGGLFEGEISSLERIQSRITDFREKRKFTQPIGASSGCIFKNPKQISAGKIVEELGFKGTFYGGAEVSMLHGNFILNRGNANSKEILTLIHLIQKEALEKTGIPLELEIKIFGSESFVF